MNSHNTIKGAFVFCLLGRRLAKRFCERFFRNRSTATRIFHLVLVSTGIAIAQDRIPRFEDFLVSPEWNGPNAEVRLVSSSERMFRTQLTQAAKQPPDFAGHYRFAGWGCGSACAAGAIVDLQNGSVFPPPLGGKGTGWDHWIFCGGVFEAPYTEYRRNSRLMIVRCTKSSIKAPDLYYLVWENDRFRQLLHGPPKP